MPSTAHGTLTPNEVTTLNLTAGRTGIVVVNRNQEGVIWVRIDGTDPVAEAPDSYAVFGAREFYIGRKGQYGDVEVRLLSDADRAYTVEAY